MNKRFPETIPAWVSLVERLIVLVLVLPSCHLVWTMVLSSRLVDGSVLPPMQAWIAEWVVRPRLLLILAATFAAGFVWAFFAKNGARRKLAILGISSTFIVVSALCLTAISFAPLAFPIKWKAPEARATGNPGDGPASCLDESRLPSDSCASPTEGGAE